MTLAKEEEKLKFKSSSIFIQNDILDCFVKTKLKVVAGMNSSNFPLYKFLFKMDNCKFKSTF